MVQDKVVQDKGERGAASGFTLIELIVVIAILGFVTMIGIKGFGNLKYIQARKMNASQIERLEHAITTYDLAKEGEAGRFDYFDSLIDVSRDGAWVGATGTCVFANAVLARGTIGVYDGTWKNLLPVFDAGGGGSGATPSAEEAKASNHGLRAGLVGKLGIYYISAADLALLQEAGISRYMLHNPSTGQAQSWCAAPEGAPQFGLGGPGFRPDLSAYYPAAIQVGSPVAIVLPVTGSGVSGYRPSSIYSDFGFAFSATNSFTSVEDGITVINATNIKLLCFAVGSSSTLVRDTLGIGRAPVNNVYDKTHYRYYIAVFALRPSQRGTKGFCRFVGVLDNEGLTYRDAKHQTDWRVKLQ